jgi:excisionase family DNA binding protein
VSADSRLRAVLLVLALLDDEDEQAAAEALDDTDHEAVFWSLVALVRSVGVEGFGSEDAFRYWLRQLAGACEDRRVRPARYGHTNVSTPPGVLGAHLRVALAGHLRQCRRDGITCPPELATLLAALLVSSGQEHSNLGDTGDDPHAVAVSYRTAAARLGVSVSTARRMAADGRLATVRAGRRVLVPVAALADYAKGA